MLPTIVLMLSVALTCESGEQLGDAPTEPEAAYGTGPHAVDPSREESRAVDPSRRSMRCVNPLRSESSPQVQQAPYKPHVAPAGPPTPEPQPAPPKPSQRLKPK
jgi:hypothetical protein